ncbi:zinc transporter 2 [Acipenser oxyrinchus oxyrinchus]|uniref:Probable proton-coupled zinc antiporter SLC30A3 n=1 Tax=Acipenser oxyrinchus oxyrinchus TaxID=40147 RepID=A0AAD8GCE2_ACIOX|nr:zinc transporter 2 [Acipenser oxyrinchus oxyrinchus]
MDTLVGSEKSHLINEKKAKFYSQKLKSPVTGSKEVYPNFPSENGNSGMAIELERHVRQHCHGKATKTVESRETELARKKLYIASVVCLIFMIGEVIGGYLAHSLAIMTDAAHLLTDFGSMMVSLFSLWVSSRPPTKTMNFGWQRSEILGALVSVLSIWIVTAVLVYLAIIRIVNNDYEIESHVMVITSGCALGVNIIMAYILHQSTTFHSHDSGYHKLDDAVEGPDSLGHGHSHFGHHGNTSVRAAFVHVIGDLLQSVGVLIAAIIIYFRPEYKVADPVCTFLFSVSILGTTVTILRDVFRILMEGAPKTIQFNSVKEVLLSLKGVKAMHSLRLWALTLSHTMLSVHIAIEEDADTQTVLKEATELLQNKFGFYSTTIQVENYCEDMSHCRQCQDPTD